MPIWRTCSRNVVNPLGCRVGGPVRRSDRPGSTGHQYLKLDGILTFWTVYILTRPLGASIGDSLAQTKADGGLGLDTTVTSVIFLLAILGVVSYLATTRRNQVALTSADVDAA